MPGSHRSYVPLAIAGAVVLLAGIAGLVWPANDSPHDVIVAPNVPTAIARVAAAPSEIAPTPVAESEARRAAVPDTIPTPASASEPRAAAPLRVLDALGNPVREARIARHDAAGRVVVATTNADGRTDFEVAVGDEVFVVARHRVLTRATCELDGDGERRVVLEDKGTIAGRVEIDGQPPGECVALTLHLARSLGLPAGFTPQLDEALGHPSREIESVTIRTADDGAFALAGLPSDASGNLYPGDWMRFEVGDGDHAVSVDNGATDLLVRLSRLPAVRFRIVDGDGSPIGMFPLTAELTHTEGWSSAEEFTTDAAGRVEVGLGGMIGDAEKYELIALDGFVESRGVVHHEAGGPWPHGTDLGDITIELPRTVALVVRDESGQTIAGARAFLDRSTSLASETDAEGSLDVHVPRTAETFLVAAVGFEVARVELDASTAAADVTLRRDSTLRVIARAPDGSPVSGLHVEITGKDAAFAYPAYRAATLPGMPDAFASSPLDVSGTETETTLRTRTDARGEAIVHRLPAGAPLKCVVRETPTSAGSTTSIVLGPGEQRTFDIPASRRGWELRVRLENEAGEQLSDVNVEAYEQDASIASETSDATGMCTLRLFGDDVVVFAGRRCDALECIQVSRATDEGITRTIVLLPQRKLDVFVSTANGQPLGAARVSALPIVNGRAWDSELVWFGSWETGQWQSRGLGAQPVSITIDVGGWKTERIVDAATTVLRVVLDDTGTVVLPPASLGDDDAWNCAYAFVARDGREVQRFPAWWFPDDAAFEISGVLAGTYDVRLVRTDGAEALVAVAENVTVSPGVTAPLHLVAAP